MGAERESRRPAEQGGRQHMQIAPDPSGGQPDVKAARNRAARCEQRERPAANRASHKLSGTGPRSGPVSALKVRAPLAAPKAHAARNRPLREGNSAERAPGA